MKIDAIKTTKKDELEISVRKKQEIKYVFKGSIKPKKNHRIFEIDPKDNSIKLAKYNLNQTIYFGKPLPKRELMINDGFIYIPAMNAANALKKFKKDPLQENYYVKEPLLKFT